MTRRKRYSAEFKREALRRANEEGVTDMLVAEELGINAVRAVFETPGDTDRAFAVCLAFHATRGPIRKRPGLTSTRSW